VWDITAVNNGDVADQSPQTPVTYRQPKKAGCLSTSKADELLMSMSSDE